MGSGGGRNWPFSSRVVDLLGTDFRSLVAGIARRRSPPPAGPVAVAAEPAKPPKKLPESRRGGLPSAGGKSPTYVRSFDRYERT